jgi:hypothetical protein
MAAAERMRLFALAQPAHRKAIDAKAWMDEGRD